MGKQASFFTHKRPSVLRRFHRAPASLGSSDLEKHVKNERGFGCLPSREAAAGFSLPRLSCGELKKLPRFLRCGVAPWREDKKQYSHAKLAKPQRKADRLNGREGLHGKTSKLLYPQKAFRPQTISSCTSFAVVKRS
jgi:hypothetical protein